MSRIARAYSYVDSGRQDGVPKRTSILNISAFIGFSMFHWSKQVMTNISIHGTENYTFRYKLGELGM